MQGQQSIERRQRPRQEPVSCQSCRVKKLKCNRQQPCSNCLARGITCQSQFRASVAAVAAVETSQLVSTNNDNAAILARLQTLEDLLLGLHRTPPPSSNSETPHSIFVAPSRTSPHRLNGKESSRKDSEWLEDVGIRTNSLISGLSDRITFRVGTIQQILAITSSPPGSQTRSNCNATNCVWLPTQDEALRLLENYSNNIEQFQHILHAPSVRVLVNDVYAHFIGSKPVQSSHVALLLSIFASTSYYWNIRDQVSLLFSSSEESNQAALMWGKAALDVLDNSRRTTSGSIEDVQATIVMYFLVLNLEGFSARSRSLMTTALVIARDLSLHRIDAQRHGQQSNSHDDRTEIGIEIEIKRRVWWYIVATDWVLAFTGGPQTGTYLVQSRHMRVQYPRNINDDDLNCTDPDFNRPLSEPTSMSYFLQRIRQAEICRSIVDSVPTEVSDVEQLDYQDVVSLDSKFEVFLVELPVFFCLDEESRQKSQAIDQRFPQIEFQRYMLGLAINYRRCKLHRPFLVHCPHQPRYTYSREVCLRSARAVIQARRLLGKGTSSFALAHLKLCTVIHYVFLATVVLVMDLCFNKVDGQDEQRKAEVMDACQMLEEATDQSAMAGQFLASLMDILKKHKIHLLTPDPAKSLCSSGSVTARAEDANSSGESLYYEPAGYSTWTKPREKQQLDHESDFDRIWHEYVELQPSSEVLDWDHLFTDLDSHVV